MFLIVPIPKSAPIEFVDETRLVMPGWPCCNCAKEESLIIVEQPTRLIRGVEWKVVFELPFCDACKKTAFRTPIGWIHRVVVFAGFFVAFWILMLALVSFNDLDWLLRHIWHSALVLSLTGVVIFYGLKRPRAPQTSYRQPVRITKLKQRFMDSKVTQMTLLFTNVRYAEEFKLLNAAAIANGRVVICRR